MVKLDLSGRGLTQIPAIPDDVTELDLSHNQIVELKDMCTCSCKQSDRPFLVLW